MISVEVLSAAVMLWWALGVILGVGYLLKVRAGPYACTTVRIVELFCSPGIYATLFLL